MSFRNDGGDFADNRIENTADDELRALTDQFNSMVDDPKVYYAELEETVAVRTRELRDSLEALRISEGRYRSLFEGSRDPIFITVNNEVVDANQATLDMMGYTRQELVGANVRPLFADPDERHRLRLELEANGAVANFPVRLTSKSGKVIDCQLTATLQLEDDGESWGIQGIVRDVTEMKRTQEALRQSEMAARRLAEENEVVAEVGRINSSSLNIEEIYQQFGDEVKKLIPYDRLARIHRGTPMDGVRKAEGG